MVSYTTTGNGDVNGHAVEAKPSEHWAGRWSFYVDGERLGSAPTRKAALRAAAESAACMKPLNPQSKE